MLQESINNTQNQQKQYIICIEKTTYSVSSLVLRKEDYVPPELLIDHVNGALEIALTVL